MTVAETLGASTRRDDRRQRHRHQGAGHRAAAASTPADARGLSPERLRRHFLRGTGANAGFMRVKPELARLIEFRTHNLMDARWSLGEPFDIVFCRNVMIYFDAPTQRRVLERIHARDEARRPAVRRPLGELHRLARPVPPARQDDLRAGLRRTLQPRPRHADIGRTMALPPPASTPRPARASPSSRRSRASPARPRSSSTTRTSERRGEDPARRVLRARRGHADHDHAGLVHRRLPVGPRRAASAA